MNIPYIQQAKEWANGALNDDPFPPYEGVAARVIQSLPDHIIDAGKVREILAEQYMKIEGNDTKWINAATIESLLTPALPTLAELIEQGNDPQKYVGMQCMMHDFPSTHVITRVRDFSVSALREDLVIQHATISKVTPLPDLPRLEWPGDGVEDAPIVDDEPDLPRPEDVPAGEAWLVNTREGEQREALKAGNGWYVKDGDDVEEWVEEALTPIARLVPEVGA